MPEVEPVTIAVLGAFMDAVLTGKTNSFDALYIRFVQCKRNARRQTRLITIPRRGRGFRRDVATMKSEGVGARH